MIRIEGLSKVFNADDGQVEALKDINMTIEKGDIYGIIGLSGAGKSTLIRCLNRLEEPSSGKIIMEDTDILKLNDSELLNLRRRIGMIFQHFNLLSRSTCSKNIAFPLEISNCDRGYIEKRVDELLELVDLKDKKNAYPSQLSGGQKQRVAIARALATKPEILLCDEATSALDPTTTKSILQLIKSINQSLNITVVIITHQMEVIKEICNKVAVISGGKIVEQGDTYKVFSNPKHPVTRNFVKDITLEIDINNLTAKGDYRFFKISFLEGKADSPIISNMVSKFGVEANIAAGNISTIQGKTYGNLIVGLKGDDAKINDALNYLNSQELYFEEIG